MTSRAWTHGCDACDEDEPVKYVPGLGAYLCEKCRRPEALSALRRELCEAARVAGGKQRAP